MFLRERYRIGNPGHTGLNSHRQVRVRRLRTQDHEEVRESVHRQAEVGLQSVRPFVSQEHSALADYVDPRQRAGHGIEASRPHDDVEFIQLAIDNQTLLRDFLDRV